MFIITNGVGEVMGYASTRKKAQAKAQRAIKRGSRCVKVWDPTGLILIRHYGEPT